MKEEWRPIEGTDGQYEVSNTGKVRSNNYLGHGKTKELKLWANGSYLRVGLRFNGKYTRFLVHRLVASAFIPNPDNLPEVNHINGNPKDNQVDNLEWVDRKSNIHHAIRTGLFDNSISNLLKSNEEMQCAIVAVNIDTKAVTKYPSIQAAQRAIGTKDINRVLKRQQFKAKGHIFYRQNEYDVLTPEELERDLKQATKRNQGIKAGDAK